MAVVVVHIADGAMDLASAGSGKAGGMLAIDTSHWDADAALLRRIIATILWSCGIRRSDCIVVELHTHDSVDDSLTAAATTVAKHTMPPPTPQSSGLDFQCPAQSSATLHIDLAIALIFAFAVALAFDLAVNKAGSHSGYSRCIV